MCEMTLSQQCDMNLLFHDSLTYAIWLFLSSATWLPSLFHDSLTRATWLSLSSVARFLSLTTPSNMWHDSLTTVHFLLRFFHACNMTLSQQCHISPQSVVAVCRSMLQCVAVRQVSSNSLCCSVFHCVAELKMSSVSLTTLSSMCEMSHLSAVLWKRLRRYLRLQHNKTHCNTMRSMCEISHLSAVWHDAFVSFTTLVYVRHDSSSAKWPNSFFLSQFSHMCDTTLSQQCDMTFSSVSQLMHMYDTTLYQQCDMTCSSLLHIWGITLSQQCDMTPSSLSQLSHPCDTSLSQQCDMTSTSLSQLSQMCGMTLPQKVTWLFRLLHNSRICITWIFLSNVTQLLILFHNFLILFHNFLILFHNFLIRATWLSLSSATWLQSLFYDSFTRVT